MSFRDVKLSRLTAVVLSLFIGAVFAVVLA
jgi:hypothetical protein